MTKVLFEILIIKAPPLLDGNVITRNGYKIQNAGSLSNECPPSGKHDSSCIYLPNAPNIL